jgi:hypothetical protein
MINRIVHALLLGSLIVSPIVVVPVRAQDDIRTERVQFKPGTTSAVIEGSINGYETVDYVLNAREGQYMNVSMATDNGANYFNILMPGENEEAMFNSSMGENQFEGILPKSGDYKLRVYMMRNAARENQVANYRLEMIITDQGKSSTKGDAVVEGTNYNATGDVSCSMSSSQPTGSCPFGVTREGNGNGLVTITKPDGSTRGIFFENGNAIGYDKSEADSGEFSAEKQGDLNIIYIGEERYEIPEVVIFGD